MAPASRIFYFLPEKRLSSFFRNHCHFWEAQNRCLMHSKSNFTKMRSKFKILARWLNVDGSFLGRLCLVLSNSAPISRSRSLTMIGRFPNESNHIHRRHQKIDSYSRVWVPNHFRMINARTECLEIVQKERRNRYRRSRFSDLDWELIQDPITCIAGSTVSIK